MPRAELYGSRPSRLTAAGVVLAQLPSPSVRKRWPSKRAFKRSAWDEHLISLIASIGEPGLSAAHTAPKLPIPKGCRILHTQSWIATQAPSRSSPRGESAGVIGVMTESSTGRVAAPEGASCGWGGVDRGATRRESADIDGSPRTIVSRDSRICGVATGVAMGERTAVSCCARPPCICACPTHAVGWGAVGHGLRLRPCSKAPTKPCVALEVRSAEETGTTT